MSSIDGYQDIDNSTLSGLETVYASSIYCDTFLGQSSSLFTGIVSNIQQQLNNMSGTISNNIPIFSIGTVSNLPTGSTPTVTINNSNALTPILSFGLVQGAKGDKGDRGDNGSQGPQGPEGPRGADGSSAGTILGALGLTIGSLSALGTLAVGILGTVEFAAITGKITVLETEVGVLQTEVDVLQQKTYFISSNDLTETTIASNLNIGSIGLIKTTIYSQSGEIDTLGKIKVNNLILLDTDGTITANSLNCSNAHIDALTTNNSSVQNINGSQIKIGLNSGSLINIGSKTTIYSDSGEMDTLGKIKVNNLITLGTSGDITSNSISVGDGHIDALTTSTTSNQNIDGSIINIGHAILLPTPDLTRINLSGAVYINGVLLQPFSSASSFFSQW